MRTTMQRTPTAAAESPSLYMYVMSASAERTGSYARVIIKTRLHVTGYEHV